MRHNLQALLLFFFAVVLDPCALKAQNLDNALTRLNPFAPKLQVAGSTTSSQSNLHTSILSDRRVMFQVQAPYAYSVSVTLVTNTSANINGYVEKPLIKGANGLWSLTVGPLEPRVWEYNVSIDGVTVVDPSSSTPKPDLVGTTTLLQIPGSIEDVRNVPHGKLIRETYFSSALHTYRTMEIYTPPDYQETRKTAYPVLFTYNGWNEVSRTNSSDARIDVMLDNLVAKKSVVPMVVVMPEIHAIPPIDLSLNSYNDLIQYIAANQAAVQNELLRDIIPFLNRHYHVRKDADGRAISGFSLGGIQALETGIVETNDFHWVAACSPEFLTGVASPQFTDALKQPNVINSNLRYLYLGIGNNDFEAAIPVLLLQLQLAGSGIHHAFEVMTPGNHNTDTCRRELLTFLTKVFR
jgi:enterochelin esterase-like enzyme